MSREKRSPPPTPITPAQGKRKTRKPKFGGHVLSFESLESSPTVSSSESNALTRSSSLGSLLAPHTPLSTATSSSSAISFPSSLSSSPSEFRSALPSPSEFRFAATQTPESPKHDRRWRKNFSAARSSPSSRTTSFSASPRTPGTPALPSIPLTASPLPFLPPDPSPTQTSNMFDFSYAIADLNTNAHARARVDASVQTEPTTFPPRHGPFKESFEPAVDSFIAALCGVSRSIQLETFIRLFQAIAVSPIDFLTHIVSSANPTCLQYRTRWFEDKGRALERFLNAVHADSSGRSKITKWMQPHAMRDFEETVNREMQAVQDELKLSSVDDLTREHLRLWDREHVLDPLVRCAPMVYNVLVHACTTRHSANNIEKKPDTLCRLILAQMARQRSQYSNKFAAVFGIFLWGTGTQHKVIGAIEAAQLTVSYESIRKVVKKLSSEALAAASAISRDHHMLGYDNINLSTSIFVEQRSYATPDKVQSGTFGFIYKLFMRENVNVAAAFDLSTLLAHIKAAPPLDYAKDVKPSRRDLACIQEDFIIITVSTLTRLIPGFEDKSHHLLQHTKSPHALPYGYRTEYLPTRVTTIDEATREGNLDYHDNLYREQLSPEDESSEDFIARMSKLTILVVCDLFTCQRIEGGQQLRAKDLNPWARREIFQVAFGLFHLLLNLIWAILLKHRGTAQEVGCLAYFFVLLEKTRLGAAHPDFHTLLATLMQILDGLLLAAWSDATGYENLAEYARTSPTAADLRERAKEILSSVATPFSPKQGEHPEQDKVHCNIRLLLRDLLYIAALVTAVQDGDFGRIEPMLGRLAMLFRGAGSNNYCTEILHMILNLKYAWTSDYANIVRDNIIVNPSGKRGHAMAADLNMEHGIRAAKTLIAAKGLRTDWERMGDAGACISSVDHVKTRVGDMLGVSAQSAFHSTPSTDLLRIRVADKAREGGWFKFTPDRAGNELVSKLPDLISTGAVKIEKVTLKAFNKKVQDIHAGRLVDGSMDADSDLGILPPAAVTIDIDNLDE